MSKWKWIDGEGFTPTPTTEGGALSWSSIETSTDTEDSELDAWLSLKEAEYMRIMMEEQRLYEECATKNWLDEWL